MSMTDFMNDILGETVDLSATGGSPAIATGLYQAEIIDVVIYEHASYGRQLYFSVNVFPKDGDPVKIDWCGGFTKQDGTVNKYTQRIFMSLLMTFGRLKDVKRASYVKGVSVDGVYNSTVTGYGVSELEAGTKGHVGVIKAETISKKNGKVYTNNKIIEVFSAKGLHGSEIQTGKTQPEYAKSWKAKYPETYVDAVSEQEKAAAEAAASANGPRQRTQRQAQPAQQAPAQQTSYSVVDDSEFDNALDF